MRLNIVEHLEGSSVVTLVDVVGNQLLVLLHRISELNAVLDLTVRLEQLHNSVLVQIILVFNQEFVEVVLHTFEGDLELLNLAQILQLLDFIHFIDVFGRRQMSSFDLLNLRELQLNDPRAKDFLLNAVIRFKL